jgi:glycosyltransferase involved in cell wall biosynthesis
MSPDGRRLLIISPVRNEAAHLECVARSLAAQTRPPDRWILIDDGSDDGTGALLERIAAELPFARVMATPRDYTADGGDRLAVAAEARAFNLALATVDWRDYTHIGKLDGDIELPPDYFERLLAEFDADPRLGIGGGVLTEPDGEGWTLAHAAPHHVRGALKLYRRECFAAIGGVQERLGWDGIDQTYARMNGYATRSFAELVARHHRPLGSADGAMRGMLRRGEVHYVLGFSLGWVLLRTVRDAASRPYLIRGGAFLWGYLRARRRRAGRVEDEAYQRFMRRDERRRLLGVLWPPAARAGGADR